MLNIPLGFSLFIHLFIQSTKIYRHLLGARHRENNKTNMTFAFMRPTLAGGSISSLRSQLKCQFLEGKVPRTLNQAKPIGVCA